MSLEKLMIKNEYITNLQSLPNVVSDMYCIGAT